ncbi:hypothetical protein FYC62_00700 [Pedobacter aquae]|uniref:DUF4263 domain-containing protein n=1 Tax=Pedobacter aquae TaxID=2605747 RepID=A0A5C0VC61_9SPHI|nr:hypothetical protein [Pedobacter aquae]QEK50348.1 hypothetical protein FYC62_00700 [Pedobacter aquae]
MKILFIYEGIKLPDKYLEKFKPNYAFNDKDIHVSYDTINAKEFITNNIITQQHHLDFIIAEFNTSKFKISIDELIQWLRIRVESYSSHNFQVSKIPFILINSELFHEFSFFGHYHDYHNNLYSGVLVNREKNPISLYNNALSSSLDIWLDELKSDLDDLNIDHLGRYKLDAKILSAKSANLRVLSEEFHKNATRLNYIWSSENTTQLASAGDDISKLVKQYEKSPSKRNEKEIHDVLKKHSHVLKGEDYLTPIYEKQLYYSNSRKYIESDFINARHKYSWNKNQIYEVKLPSERFVRRNNKDFVLSRFRKYLRNQLGKYYEYFTNEQNLKHMVKRFQNENIDITNQDFDFALLIGRDTFREENLYLIEQEITFNNYKIDLITYDDVIRKHEYLYQRLKRFSLA